MNKAFLQLSLLKFASLVILISFISCSSNDDLTKDNDENVIVEEAEEEESEEPTPEVPSEEINWEAKNECSQL